MKILISGAGIAGPCLAFWLERHGHQPTIVERAPRPRGGGYIVDFWGAGFDVAQRMGLLPQILQRGYTLEELRQVDREGKRVSGFSMGVFSRLTHGRFTSVPRGDLAAVMHAALDDRVETIFGDTVTEIEDTGGEVRVRFERTPERAFDLVVGADGLHSIVRRLVFGEADGFERYLGLKVGAFDTRGYRPRDELTYVIHTELGQQVGRFSMRDDRTLFLFVFADPRPEVPSHVVEQKMLLRRTFKGSGWECPHILEALDREPTLYLDSVSQVRMNRWARGRVALVGDAASCVSLLGGQGSALAMVGAYVLAGELKRANGDYLTAFDEYQRRLGVLMARKQEAAVRFAPFFAPRSRVGMFVRNQVMKLMSFPLVAQVAIERDLRDAVDLPCY